MTINVNRSDQVESEDSPSEGLVLLAKIIVGYILREKVDQASKTDMPDEPNNLDFML